MRLLELLKEEAFEKKPVTLASGRHSNFYIDVKRTSLHPEGSVLIGQGLFDLIQKQFPTAKAAGGLTLGADPLATSLAYTSWLKDHPLRAFIVRKQAKSHGLGLWIEGAERLPAQTPVVVLEDVVTSGKSALEAIDKILPMNWQILGVAAVVDRQEGGREAIEARGFRLYSLFTKRDFGILE
jgi:orotate phosphoribosyltransferase